MSATTVPFGNLRKVMRATFGLPGIGANRNLGSLRTAADPDRILCLRIEVVGDELVQAIQGFVNHVEEDHAPIELGLSAYHLDRLLMFGKKRATRLRHGWGLGD